MSVPLPGTKRVSAGLGTWFAYRRSPQGSYRHPKGHSVMRGLHDRVRQCRRNQRRAVRRREQVLLFEALESRFLLTATADDSRPVGGVTVDPLAHSSSSLIV